MENTNQSRSDRDYMRLALSEARSAGADVPVGAVVVLAGEIIGTGCNMRESTADPTAHAEIVAIRTASRKTGSWRLNGAVLYSSLEPCPMCAEAIIQSRISRLVFGAYDLHSGAAGSAFNLFCRGRIYPIPEVVGGIMEEQCQRLLLEFFRASKSR